MLCLSQITKFLFNMYYFVRIFFISLFSLASLTEQVKHKYKLT